MSTILDTAIQVKPNLTDPGTHSLLGAQEQTKGDWLSCFTPQGNQTQNLSVRIWAYLPLWSVFVCVYVMWLHITYADIIVSIFFFFSNHNLERGIIAVLPFWVEGKASTSDLTLTLTFNFLIGATMYWYASKIVSLIWNLSQSLQRYIYCVKFQICLLSCLYICCCPALSIHHSCSQTIFKLTSLFGS